MNRQSKSPLRAVWRCVQRLVLRPFSLSRENARLRYALHKIAKRGANPITEFGYGTERPWVRLADDVWEISREALKENVEVILRLTEGALRLRG